MFEFKLPDLGEGIHEGELLKWHVKEKDVIREDDPLCDMETDKATVTIPSPRAGTIFKLNGKPGDTIEVNQILVVIDESSSDQPLEIETTATPEDPPAKEDVPASGDKALEKDVTAPGDRPPKKRVAAAPATRRLARELGVDITAVDGTGSGGKVTPDDVKLAADSAGKSDSGKEARPAPAADLEAGGTQQAEPVSGIPFLEIADLPDFEARGPVEKIPMRSLRKKVAAKTTTSMILIPHVAHMDEWDMTEFETLREQLNREKSGSDRITLLPFVVKAVASLLGKYPEFNASVDPRKLEIIHKKYYHIGIAADTPKGLIVPVIKDAGQKSVTRISEEIRSLSAKGREGTITPEELTGSTFTITNVGAIGGTGMVPTINYPESAILGLGRAAPKPVVKEKDIVIRTILPVTLCFDHRVADGAGAAHFMQELKQMLESPALFMTRV